jgi:short-subunit dehydrogenase
MTKLDFKGKVIIITGASSGIGKELALQFAQQGAYLSLGARNADRLKMIMAECLEYRTQVISIPTDVTIQEQCSNLINQTLKHFGRIDILINNAGRSMWVNFEEVKDLNLFEQLMRINYLGSVYCSYYALPYLKQTQGLIVGISSLTGKTGVPTRTGYAASKHAMAGFFDSLRIELSNYNVGVTVIYPGFVKTEMRERAFGPDGKALGESPMQEGELMSVEKCAQQIISAIQKRKRELVMTSRGKIGLWMKLIAPSLVDRTALKSITVENKKIAEVN